MADDLKQEPITPLLEDRTASGLTQEDIISQSRVMLKNRQLRVVEVSDGPDDDSTGLILIHSDRTGYCFILVPELLRSDMRTALWKTNAVEYGVAQEQSLLYPGQDVAEGCRGVWLESFIQDLNVLLAKDADLLLLEAYLRKAVSTFPSDWYEQSEWKEVAIQRFRYMLTEPIINAISERSLAECQSLDEVLDTIENGVYKEIVQRREDYMSPTLYGEDL